MPERNQKIIHVHMYEDDVQKLDKIVQLLKRRGHTNMNRSKLARIALDQLNVHKIPHRKDTFDR